MSWTPILALSLPGCGVLEEERSNPGVLGATPRPWPVGGTSSGCGPVRFAQLAGFSEARFGRGDSLGTETVLGWTPKPA